MLTPLDGTNSQKEWASRIRSDVQKAGRAHWLDNPVSRGKITDGIMEVLTIKDAEWWIRHRHFTIRDFVNLGIFKKKGLSFYAIDQAGNPNPHLDGFTFESCPYPPAPAPAPAPDNQPPF